MSQNEGKQFKIYPGWLMVLTGFMAMVIIYPAGISLMSLFIEPIAETFNVSTTSVSIQFSLITFSSMLGSALAGSLIDKIGLKKTKTMAAIIASLSFFAIAFSPSIWLNYIAAIIIGISTPILTNVGIAIMINTWFGKKLSGQAIGIAMIGSGVGAMILTPIVSMIISNFTNGWRPAYILIGALTLLIYTPLVLLLVKDKPEDLGLTKIGLMESDDSGTGSVKDSPNYGLTFQDAKSTSAFYVAAASFISISFVALLFFTLSFSFFTYSGYNEGFASTLMSIQALALIFGKYGVGALSSKTNPYLSTIIALLCQLFGIIGILFSSSGAAFAMLGVILFGFGNAAGTISIPLLVEDVFGNVAYGQIVGVMTMFAGFGSALAPIISTSIVNLFNSQIIPWVIAIIVLILTCIGIITLQKMSKDLESRRIANHTQAQ